MTDRVSHGLGTFRAFLKKSKAANDLLDKHGMILFFRRGDDLFGSPEDGRVVFAKLKGLSNGEDDDDPMAFGFRDEARFMGINLLKALSAGSEEGAQTTFGMKDIPGITVCDRDEAVKTMMRKHKKAKE